MRTLNDIVPPSRRRDGDDKKSAREPLVVAKRPPRFSYTTLVAILLVIAVSIGVLFYFSTAKIEITPNAVSAAVQNTYTATPSGALPYQVITVEKTASQSVASSGTKKEDSSASGQLTIYNAQSKPQALVANTRFASPSGLIFRIRTAVTVPAGTTDKPGSKAVTVYADKAGASYNIGPSSFTVPGFAGTPQATKVYARSTAAMAGGASGNVPFIESSLEAKTRASLTSALAPDLLKSLNEQVPAGYILIPGAATTTYQAAETVPSEATGLVEVKQRGVATAVVFPNAALAKAIASSIAGLEYQGEPVILGSNSDVRLTPANGIPTESNSAFSFTMAGTASLIYSVDSDRIAAAISGKTRSAAEVAITNFPEVKRAVIILRPFWRQTFPADPAAIAVAVAGDGN